MHVPSNHSHQKIQKVNVIMDRLTVLGAMTQKIPPRRNFVKAATTLFLHKHLILCQKFPT